MARDNSPKERQKRQLERKQGRRANYDRILIVCEGSKTEPNYFKEIRSKYRLHTANIEVQPSESGTAPIQVVEHAKALFEFGDRHKNIQKRAFERVYAIFDRDDHKSYFAALMLAQSINGKLKNDNNHPIVFEAIVSVPCFELWLLLHFEDVQTPLHRDEVMRRLKMHLPDYEKGTRKAFGITCDHLEIATNRAERLSLQFNAHTDPEPYTAIHQLVGDLTKLR